jgi:hypothetical protein
MVALAYPPDIELPEHVVLEFAGARMWASGPDRHSYVGGGYQAEGRKEAALMLLALGDQGAIELRRRVWTAVSDTWVLSPEVIEAARSHHCSLADAERAIGQPIPPADDAEPDDDTTTVRWTENPEDGTVWVDFLEVARVVEFLGPVDNGFAQIWSDQVKDGQVVDPR